ncbi:D-glycero-beta-D-manno-heptose 1,7-bisphosphate 7-phosphatase [Alteromonas sediminis]|uniref:D,D-heptose 1,7-bisphosphate phosphatase n=1 Tax=Alteromonas sediminis TaxID=2259342 RepID=A0A3N5ZCD4_9ALTE|nr:D-glycero-beta-D-manno-heptose 1,7-bisphosphate 7-phosphatase [Alteromonas sediminis]RPJ67548.1 D-glycero-beta-D-manno-heptose 1,7-bisphosphate 7-phosphatase [Alteromonas sediminis]
MHKALFLDRDGVINIDKGYIYQAADVEWVPGVIDIMQAFKNKGYKIIVVTNQSGIGRGYYSEKDFHALMTWMNQALSASQVQFDGVYFCPHHPEHALGKYKKVCGCRKPAGGMLFDAIEAHHINPADSTMIGDSWRDVMAAEEAGVGQIYYLAQQVAPHHQEHIDNAFGKVKAVSKLSQILESK